MCERVVLRKLYFLQWFILMNCYLNLKCTYNVAKPKLNNNRRRADTICITLLTRNQ